jgi:hypothetical protein
MKAKTECSNWSNLASDSITHGSKCRASIRTQRADRTDTDYDDESEHDCVLNGSRAIFGLQESTNGDGKFCAHWAPRVWKDKESSTSFGGYMFGGRLSGGDIRFDSMTDKSRAVKRVEKFWPEMKNVKISC